MTKTNDMRIEPMDGAPISLKKISDDIAKKGKSGGTHILIDGSASGFINDDPHLVNVTIREREIQADYFIGLNLPLPPYLKKYLEFMYEDEKLNIESMYKYAATNQEMKQLIGLIQLVGGSLKMARDRKSGVRLYIEEPETRMHPKRDARIMLLLEMLKKDYGFEDKKDGK